MTYQLKVFIVMLFIYMVSDFSMKWKCGIQTLEMNTLRLRYSRKFTSSHGLILVIGKAKLLLLPEYYMVYALLSFDGMEMFSGCIRYMVLFMCNMEPAILMQQNEDIYKYIDVYVDDL